jgi:uroporphyrinogen decarboxylase
MDQKINPRERFLKIARFERKNDPMWFFLDAWYEAFVRWKEEGMPVTSLTRPQILGYLLGYDNSYQWLIPNSAIKGIGPLNNPPWVPPLEPPYEDEVIEETGTAIIKREFDGTIIKISKANPRAIPQYLEYPVKDRKSWELFKKRLNPFTASRFPKGWDIISKVTVDTFPLKEELEGKHMKERDFVLHMACASLLGMPRNYMGVENLSLAMHDDPNLVEDMIEHQMYFAIETIKLVFRAGVVFDAAFIWEDIAYNKGSIFPIKFIREKLLPRYNKITTLLRENGVEVITLDSDGNIEELLPLWIEGGINCTYPLEVASGMDPLKLRKKYGRNLILTGGIDKRELAKGKKEIDDQVAIVGELIKNGGYFVQADHHIPHDVSYENLVYFINEVNKLCQYPEFRREIK